MPSYKQPEIVRQTKPIVNVSGRCTARSKSKIRHIVIRLLKDKGVVIADPWKTTNGEVFELGRQNGIDWKDDVRNEFPYEAVRCSKTPIAGGNVCIHHGGLVPVIKRRAEKRLALETPFALAAIHNVLVSGATNMAVVAAAKLVIDKNKIGDGEGVEQHDSPIGDLTLLTNDELETLQRLLKKTKREAITPGDVRNITPESVSSTT